MRIGTYVRLRPQAEQPSAEAQDEETPFVVLRREAEELAAAPLPPDPNTYWDDADETFTVDADEPEPVVAEAPPVVADAPPPAVALTTELLDVMRTTQQTVGVLAAAMADRQSSDRVTLATLEALSRIGQHPAPDIHVHVPKHDLSVQVDSPRIDVHVPEQPSQPAPNVNVYVPEQETHVHLPEQAAPVIHLPEQPSPVVNVTVERPKPQAMRIERHPDGSKTFTPEEPE